MIVRILKHIAKILLHKEKLEMADFTKLTADIAALSAKVDAFVASDTAKDAKIADLEAQLAAVPPVVVPVDEQPAVDAADGAVAAIAAKLP